MSTLCRLMVVNLIFALAACMPLEPVSPQRAEMPDPGPEWVVFNHETFEMPAALTVFDFAADDQGAMWIGTSAGLARHGEDGWTWYTTENSGLPHNRVIALTLDGPENLWVGTHDGLAQYDGETWEVFTTDNSGLPYESIHELALDPEGILWIGTGRFYSGGDESGGLARFDGTEWQTYDFENSPLPSNYIIGLATDDQGTVWVGTVGSLLRFDGEQWTDIAKEEGSKWLKGYSAPGISMDTSGDIWVSAGSNGVAHFDGDQWARYTEADTPVLSEHTDEIFIDSGGTKWIGTRAGVAKFDDGGWTIYDTSNSDLSGDWVWAIEEDAYGNIWIGTNYDGLAVYREGGVLLP